MNSPNPTASRLRLGRWLTDDDVKASRRLAVVNEAFANRYFDGHSPLGRQVRMPRLNMPPFGLKEVTFEITGVAQDALHELHNGEARPEVYIPYSITGMADTLLIHTTREPTRLAQTVRREVYQLDKSQAMTIRARSKA